MTSLTPRRPRRRSRGWFLATVAGVLAPVLMVSVPTSAGPAVDGAPDRLAAAATIEDQSLKMPRTASNEVTGDFLGKGHDQRAVVEASSVNPSGNLNIYDRDGTILSSTPTDLLDLSESGETEQWTYFQAWHTLANDGYVGRIQLAWAPGSGFFMAGVQTSRTSHVLYQLPSDGSCATQSCAIRTTQLPTVATGGACFFPGPVCRVTTTALAVGEIGARPVIALGLSSWTIAGGAGIYIIDQSDGTVLDSDLMAASTHSTTPVTALDWDDTGSGLLAFAVLSDLRNVYAVKVPADGTLSLSNRTYLDIEPSALGSPPLSIAIGHRTDGSPVVAAGLQGGSVKLWDPKVQSPNLLADYAGSTDAIEALTFTDRIDGTTGVPDLVAVGHKSNSARVLRYDGTATLQQLPVAAGGDTKTDIGGIRAWFPGYKSGLVTFELSGGDPAIQLEFATRPNASYGCWFAQGFDGAPALPTTPVILDGTTNLTYTVAALTAGAGGACAASDFTGQWAAYVVATPRARPADRTVAKLVWSRGGQVSVQSVGGSVTLSVDQNAKLNRPLGQTRILVKGPQRISPPSTLTVKGTQLDAAGTDRPVYRFDVAATNWALPVSNPPRIQAVLEPLHVVGYTDDGRRVDLGLLVPQGQPRRATAGSVTLSPVSFYWQNPDVGPQIEVIQVHVKAGTKVVESNTILLSNIPAPAPGTSVELLQVCAATGSTQCGAPADPVANGLDQAPLRIQLYVGSTVLPLTDPVYGRIYYRDQNGDLVTGLIPEDGSAYIRVSPYAGAYPNDGSTATPTPCTTRCPNVSTVGGRFGYLSTTTTVEQEITAYVGGSNPVTNPVVVDAINFTPQVAGNAQAGSGFYVNGCTGDYAGTNVCKIADPQPPTQLAQGNPALFLTADPDTQELRIGLQLSNTAQTSLTGLPLQQLAGQPEHKVAAQPLTISNGDVHLSTTSGFQPADTIDTWLVIHGTQLPIRNVQVGGGN